MQLLYQSFFSTPIKNELFHSHFYALIPKVVGVSLLGTYIYWMGWGGGEWGWGGGGGACIFTPGYFEAY